MLYTDVPASTPSTPESALWCAVIIQALRDAGDRFYGPTARDWLQSDSEKMGSLRWIATMLDLDADVIARLSYTREGRNRILRRESSAVWGYGTDKYQNGEG